MDLLQWDTNLRTNLRLWPVPLPNVVALASRDGAPYNEEDLLTSFPFHPDRKAPTDTRAVRNTFEVLAYAGMAYRSGETPERFRLTSLGLAALSFVGAVGGDTFAREANRRLLARFLIRGLSLVVENRAIWGLMLGAGGVLSNEELNRCMARVRHLEDVPAAAEAVLAARRDSDPTSIGPRLYKDGHFGGPRENDQRKAMNPLFLLAGGGGWFIEVDRDPQRQLLAWARSEVARSLARSPKLVHASTSREVVIRISDYSGARV